MSHLLSPLSSRGAAPSFLQKPVIKQADGGKKILFECKIAADPKPTLTWYREDKVISEGGQYSYLYLPSKGAYFHGRGVFFDILNSFDIFYLFLTFLIFLNIFFFFLTFFDIF